MRTVLIMTLVVVLSASLAFAQAGRIGIYGTPTPASVDDCNVVDNVAGLLEIYCVHVGTTGAAACQFSAVVPDCFTGTYLSDGSVYGVTVGNSQTGVAVGYGLCVGSPNHVLTINVFASGTTPPCCIFEVGPDPNVESGEVEIVDCDLNLLFGAGQSGVINGNASCACADIVPTEKSSWGQIKALYSSQQ